jgi:polyisoprenoid-binding protein YceI
VASASATPRIGNIPLWSLSLQRSLLALLLLFLPMLALAAPARYVLDPVHTRVMFAINHAGFSNALGTISGSQGTLVFDADDWASAQLDVSVPVNLLDLGDSKWNQASLARNLLDGEAHPTARFVSTSVEAIDATRALVHGQFTLRGVTQPLTLDVTLNALKRHPLPPFRRTAGFSASAVLKRSDYGIDAWQSVIGNEVRLQIEVEATREGRAEPSDPLESVPMPAPDISIEKENAA